MTEQRIVDRIRKMLNLANDLAASEHERDTALRMAYNLLAKYNLDLEDVKEKAQSEQRINNDVVIHKMPWARIVGKAVAELLFCRHYVGMKVNTTQIHHHFVGKESNAITAAVMANWIIRSIVKESRARYGNNLAPDARAFSVGAAERLRERVAEMRREAEVTMGKSTGTSLVLASLYQTEAEGNAQFLRDSGIQLVALKSSRKPVGRSAYGAGREYGNGISLNRQVAQSPQGRLR